MPKAIAITTTGLSLAEFDAILRERKPIALAKDAVRAVKRSHAWLQRRRGGRLRRAGGPG